MPFLVLAGEKASGTVLIDQTKLVANNVKGIIVKGSGHWLMEEAPSLVIPEVVSFINDAPDTASIQRLTPMTSMRKATDPGVGTRIRHSDARADRRPHTAWHIHDSTRSAGKHPH